MLQEFCYQGANAILDVAVPLLAKKNMEIEHEKRRADTLHGRRICELEKENEELKRYKALEEHLPERFAIGDDATAELAVKLSKTEQALSQAEEKLEKVTVDNIIQQLEKLSQEQTKAVIKAVDKKGLMKTDWGDIDAEGGSLTFKVIAQALHAFIQGE